MTINEQQNKSEKKPTTGKCFYSMIGKKRNLEQKYYTGSSEGI